MAKKTTIIYQEKYIKGIEVNKEDIKRIINDNLEKMVIEMRERTKYYDNTEGIVIELRF